MASIVYMNVPLVGQPSSMTCWYASFQMLLRWYRKRAHHNPRVGKDIDTPAANARIRKSNQALNPFGVVPFARGMGFNVTPFSSDVARVTGLLSMFGPLWYGGMLTKDRRVYHAVVITGIRDGTILFKDPFPIDKGVRGQLKAGLFFSLLKPMRGAHFVHI